MISPTILVGLFKKDVRFLKNIYVIFKPTLRPDKDSKEVTIDSGPNGGVDSIAHWDDDRESGDYLGRGSDRSVKVGLDDDYRLSLSPDGTGEISLDDDETTITGNRDGTLTIEKPYVDPNTGASGASITTTYKVR